MSEVLIVEDDLVLASAISASFGDLGVKADVARSLTDAMSLILKGTYDLAVLDLYVLGGATMSLSNLLRTRSPQTAILSITGSSAFVLGEHNDTMRADYLIRKPVAPQEVTAMGLHLMGQQNRIEAVGRQAGAA